LRDLFWSEPAQNPRGASLEHVGCGTAHLLTATVVVVVVAAAAVATATVAIAAVVCFPTLPSLSLISLNGKRSGEQTSVVG
jgi:hypothetical protein